MKNKKIIILIILILISILTLIGSSYALLTKTFTSKKLSVEVGTLKVDFTEGNAITLDNTKPMSDSDGLNTTPYTFTITNSGTIDSYYTISNEEDTNNTLDTTYLKYKLVSNYGYDSDIKRLKDTGTGTYRIVDERALQKSKNVTYKLYLWIASDASNDIQNKIYRSKIIVNSISNKETLDMKCKSVGGKYIDGECRKYYVMKNNLVNIEKLYFGNENDGNIINRTYNTTTKTWSISYTGSNKWFATSITPNVETVKHLYYGYYESSCSEIGARVEFFTYNNQTVYFNPVLFHLKDNAYSYYYRLSDDIDVNKITSYASYLQYNFFPTTTKLSPTYTLKNYMVIDLTLMFGAGNEPSKEWCDKNLNRYIEYSETGIKTPISSINYTGTTSYYDVIDISK